MSKSRELTCDVAIAGGGMVGLSLAAALADLPLDVVVIEPVAPAADQQPSFDSRTTALSGGSRRVLEGIGVWATVANQATPIRRIHVSERGAFGAARLTAAEQGVASLGYTIENRLLGRALRERAAGIPRLKSCHARVRGLQAGAGAVLTAWQATPSINAGASRRQRSKARGQRGLKAQPGGGSIGLGISPFTGMR